MKSYKSLLKNMYWGTDSSALLDSIGQCWNHAQLPAWAHLLFALFLCFQCCHGQISTSFFPLAIWNRKEVKCLHQPSWIWTLSFGVWYVSGSMLVTRWMKQMHDHLLHEASFSGAHRKRRETEERGVVWSSWGHIIKAFFCILSEGVMTIFYMQ